MRSRITCHSFKTALMAVIEVSTKEQGSVDLAAHLSALADGVRSGHRMPAGRLFGLPELPWVDIAGAAAFTGVPPKTITSWLTRGGPRSNPFPSPHRHLYRLLWPRREIVSWLVRRHAHGPTSGRPAADPAETARSTGRPANVDWRSAQRGPISGRGAVRGPSQSIEMPRLRTPCSGGDLS